MMTYSKPEVTLVGNAYAVIQHNNKDSQAGDPNGQFNAPAYDLDE